MDHHQSNEAPKILYDRGIFMESPRWRGGAYWFSDIGAGQVLRAFPDGRQEVVLDGLAGASGLGWTRSGDLLVASLVHHAIYRVDAGGVRRVFCGPEQHGTFSTNDMATAGSRSYVTCSGRGYEVGSDAAALAQPVGKILLLDHDTGVCRTVADGMKMPNGVAITTDGRTLIVAELYARRVLRFQIKPDGGLSTQTVLAEFDHIVDGLCLDAEGALWLGTGLHRFQRVSANGEPLEAVEVPGWSCVAPMLGGPDGRTLIMAANQMDTPDAIFDGRAMGRILTARVRTPAAAEFTGW
jgi:sugar lactone lactonase YvrE